MTGFPVTRGNPKDQHGGHLLPEDVGSRRTIKPHHPDNQKSGYTYSGQPFDTQIHQLGSAEEGRGADKEEDSVSESRSSEEEEEKDEPIFLSSDKEYQGSETPSDPVDKPETPPF